VTGPRIFRYKSKRRIARIDPNHHDTAMHFLHSMRKLTVAALLTLALVLEASSQTNALPEILVTDATNHMSQLVVVRDVVVQVALRQTLALLNLNQKYPKSPLTCVIRADHTNKFPDLETYLGQRVEVSGRITEYQGRPQIILTSTNQIRILNAAPINIQPPPATNEPATKAAAVAPPTLTPTTVLPTADADAKPERVGWWIVGGAGLLVGLMIALAVLLWRQGVGNSGGRTAHPPLALVSAHPNATPETSRAEDWKQRALVAEAMAGRQGQILREKLMPELAEFAKQSLVQGLYAQRNALLETQQVAQQALVELETRLAKLQLSLPERIRAYEKRIGELEKEVESQGEEMRELTRATLVLVRKKLEDERERQRERTTGRFN